MNVSATIQKLFFVESTNEIEGSISSWTQVTVDSLTEIYERDVEFIGSMPGVNMISL